MNKKILILYAKSGFLGHKIIADDYAALLKKSGFEVEKKDVFALEGKAVVKGGEKIYLWGIKAMPWLWRFLYKYWTRIPGASWFKNSFLPKQYPKTQKFILDYRPDLVLSTHPVATAVASYIKSKVNYKLFTTFSDWHTQPFHVYKNVDKYLVVTPEEEQDVIKLGFKPEQVAVPGILVAEKYYNAPNKSEARQKLNLPKAEYVVLVMGGGKGWETEKTIKALTQTSLPLHAIIVGGSEEKKKELEKILDSINYKSETKNFSVTGFIEPSLYFAAADLLISKPGGLTTSQAFLLKLPLFITSALPGQEDENIKYLLKKGAVVLADDNIPLSKQIENLLSDEEKRQQTAENAYSIAPVKAPQIALETIQQTLYSDNTKA